MRTISVIAALITLSACGTLEQNADVPRGVYTGLDAKKAPQSDSNVTITQSGKSIMDGGKYVRGYSCQNKMWQPAANEENAIALMKKQANELGLNAIHSVKIEKDPTAVSKNCWSGISAHGIAYKL